MRIEKSRLHDEILECFLEYENPKIEYKLYKTPDDFGPNIFQYNHVILLCENTVYKIHPKVYEDYQKTLTKNLNNFFQLYPFLIRFSSRYESKVCWTEWERIKGYNLGLTEFDQNTWVKFLTHVVEWWNLHLHVSSQLNVKSNYMWWHDDVTAWNVICDKNGNFILIDWDDFILCKVNDAKKKLIEQNLEYAKMMNQSQPTVHKYLGDL